MSIFERRGEVRKPLTIVEAEVASELSKLNAGVENISRVYSSHIADGERQQLVGQKFGISMNALHSGDIVRHDIDGDPQEIVKTMAGNGEFGDLRDLDINTDHLDKIQQEQEPQADATVADLTAYAAEQAQSRDQALQTFYNQEAA